MKTIFVNQNVIVSIFAVMLLTCSVQSISFAQDAPDTFAEFNDINLASRVRDALGLPTGDGVDLLKIPKAELAKLTELNFSRGRGQAVYNLTGLEHATQLTLLNLDGFWTDHNVTDITPLAQLTKLTDLNLYSNNVSDIIPLAQLIQLTHLNLGRNRISDITPLAQLTQLATLNLEDMNISDLTPLAHLKQLGSISAAGFSGAASEIPLIKVSAVQPLAEATLNGSSVVLTLLRAGTAYDVSTDNIRNALTVSGIEGVTVSDLTRISDTEVKVVLGFTGDFDTNDPEIEVVESIGEFHTQIMLNFAIEAKAISGFDARALTGNIRVYPEGGPTITASTAQPLTVATLNEAKVELTISHAIFIIGLIIDIDIRRGHNLITVSGIPDISIIGIEWNVRDRTKLGIVLGFNGDISATDTTLTLTVEPGAIENYNGPPFTVQIPVKGVTAAELPQVMVASTPYPLTEATLNGSVVTLKLTSESYSFRFRDTWRDYEKIKVSGIGGITIARRGWNWATSAQAVRKISDTEITVELRFSGSIDTDATLILTVEPDVLTPYNGPPLTAEIPVSATTEVEPTGDLVASTPFPLTKATLDGNFVVLTLQNPSYAYKTPLKPGVLSLDYREHRQVGISGIHDVKTGQFTDDKYVLRLSRTEIMARIDFQGDFDTDVVLTFTVPPSIIENYEGPPLTAALPVSVQTELQVLIPELQQQPMFWVNTNTGKIESTEYFDAITNEVTVLTVDRAGGKLYWGERGKSGGTIKRADFDGTNVEVLVTLSSVPLGIVVDAMRNRMYWTNFNMQIQTATLDGEDISTVVQLEEDIGEKIQIKCSSPTIFLFFFTSGGCREVTVPFNLTTPTDIALNTVGGRLYWTEFYGRIRRVNLDGTGLATLLSDIGQPYGITVAGEKIYWAEEVNEYSGKIQRSNLNGTNVETLATVQGLPTGISIDTAAGKVYWANSLGGIQRTDLNGGEVEVVLSGISSPGDFVLVPSVQPATPETPAATDATVSISPASVASPAVGDQLDLSLNITGGETVAGYQATVQFDSTVLRYVSGVNGDYLPTGAFFVQPKVEGNLVKLNAVSLAGESNGDGTLATLTFEVFAVKASTLTLADVLLTDSAGKTSVPNLENADITEPSAANKLIGDVNGDGTVNIADLVLVASSLGQTGKNAADVNGDGVVNIADLVLVAGALGNNAAAPSLHFQALEMLTVKDVKQWLTAAQHLNLTDATFLKGILFLQQLVTALTPKQTELLANYPNPFNPETWIPYNLAKDANVRLHIYAMNGTLVRTLALGHQAAGMYQNRSRAAYWDGKNQLGEKVASGLYFYTLTAGEFTATRKMLIRK